MDVLGCPRKDVAVTLSWYRREHRRRRPAPADSALKDCQAHASRTAPRSAILVRVRPRERRIMGPACWRMFTRVLPA
jgi:hypothetical protein